MPMRIGHRGAAGYAPENTLASFRKALELGCDGVELDVHMTRDGHLVVIHDPFLDRTTDRKGLIRDLTLAEVRAADAGGWWGPEFRGERVPTLDEVIELTAPAGTRLFIEMKAGSIHYPGIEAALLEAIRRHRCQDRVQVSSFDHHGLRRLRELAPDLSLGVLYLCHPLDPVGMARAIGANALHPAWYFVTPEVVQAAHAAGLEVYAWDVDRPEAAALMRMAGVDGIIADYPDRI
ncbi:MAG: glycerophosphodiester phosphodiesterase [Bacillota bacterium]|nr:MAG: hypothetical protein DIU70_07850 [Bacillota bacterium]